MPIIAASNIYNSNQLFTNHALVLDEQNFYVDIVPVSEVEADEFYEHCTICPSFIDLQVYGAANLLFAQHPSVHALEQLVAHNLQSGTAFCLPTVATNTYEVFYHCIDAIKAYWKKGGKGILGLHIEGPWINKVKKGAHHATCIHAPLKSEVQQLLAYGEGVIQMITLAPEICDEHIIQFILENNIVLSAGHSNANFDEATHAFNNGITAVTHLYNAMSGFEHRAPGMVGASFLHPSVYASIIPDGYHVDFNAIKIAHQMMKNRLFAITDAVTTTTEGFYLHQLDGDKYVSNGVLSGSALTMITALQNLVEKVGITLEQAIQMCSIIPAKVIKQPKLSEWHKGLPVHFTVFNQQYQVLYCC